MNDDRVRRVQDLFAAALELDPAARGSFVERAEPDDAAVRAEVLSLLAHGDAAGGFLEAPALAHDVAGAPRVERIGGYEILGALGQGGMGIVHLARQESPRRLVALKVLRAGFTSARALKRFAHEAEVLGRLHHSGIAHVYEAGTYDPGSGPQPYFAMEYVRGATLVDHAAKHRLGARERLALVADVCDAVQHAHDRGVIHRDLKPSNVLVEETASGPRVKVLDFGIARVTDSDVQTMTMLTDVGQVVGTVPYMSPEQAGGDPTDVDARSDVYALGVIAYEILSGRLPHDLRDKRIHEAVRIVREEDPTPLSGHVPVLRGDVETVVGKALEKDRSRRYASAAAFAADIRRWLGDQPIEARPPSRTYKLARFARRNRALVVGAACVFVALLAGIVGTTTQMVRAERERDRVADAKELADARFREAERLRISESALRARSESALKRAETVARFQREMFERAAPGRDGRTLKVADVLDGAAQSIAGTLGAEPDLEAALRTALGTTYRSLGLLEESERELRSALDLITRTYGESHADTHLARARLAYVLQDRSRLDEARPLLDTALAGLAAALGEDHPETLAVRLSRATSIGKQGDVEQAESDMRRVLAARKRLLGERASDTLTAMGTLGTFLQGRGRMAEAEDLLRGALAGALDADGERAPDTLTKMSALATCLRQKGALEEAEPIYRRVYDLRREIQGDRHFDTFTAMNNLAGILQEAKKSAEAEALFRECLRLRIEVLGEEHRDTLLTMNNLALLLSFAKKLDEAEELQRRALTIKTRVLGERDPSTITSRSNLALVQYMRGDVEGALASYREVLAAYVAVHGERHARTGQAHDNVGGCLMALKRWDEAEAELLFAWDVLKETQGEQSTRARGVAGRLVDLYTARGRADDAATWRRRSAP